MGLKTDYKNDIFQGERKYRQTNNGDGTISLNDVTAYQIQGDIFSAGDINATNKEVNQNKVAIDSNTRDIQRATRVLTGLVPASGWSNNAPYMQSITIQGVMSTDTPICGLYNGDEPSAAVVKARKKAFGHVDRLVTGNNTVTLYCYNSKPITNFTIQLKGV